MNEIKDVYFFKHELKMDGMPTSVQTSEFIVDEGEYCGIIIDRFVDFLVSAELPKELVIRLLEEKLDEEQCAG